MNATCHHFIRPELQWYKIEDLTENTLHRAKLPIRPELVPVSLA